MFTRQDGSLNQRGRLLRTVAGLAVLVAALVMAPQAAAGGSAGSPDQTGAPQSPVYDTHTVADGETLWAIASAHAPGSDTQVAVQAIMDFNGLDTAALRAGQQILLPPLG